MKDKLIFLETHSKWIIRILVLLGLFFIIKLWSNGLSLGCGGGGFISLCIIPSPEYHWSILGYLSLLLFIISIFLIYKIKKSKTIIKKIQLALLIFIIGISSKQILFLISDDFKFYMSHVEKKYMDKDGNITDFDLYLELITKYCKDNKHSEIANCNGKTVNGYNTVEEYIKVLDHANKYDYRDLYTLTYNNFELSFGLEKMIKAYDDDTFYGYLIIKNWSNVDMQNLISSKTETFKSLFEYIQIEISEGNKLLDKDIKDEFWLKLDNNIRNKLKETKEVNYKIF